MSKKRIILSDSSLNCYGYRVLTQGIDLEAFIKNPIMMWMHFRDEGSMIWGNNLPIGYWSDIQINGDELSAIPVFDKVGDLSMTLSAKYEAGTINAASIGFYVLATSSEPDCLLPGQTRETVTKCIVRECSLVDIPANSNAVRLYDSSTTACLSAEEKEVKIPLIKQLKDEKFMKLQEGWKALLSFLKVDKSTISTAELSVENLESVNTELERLVSVNTGLLSEKEAVEVKLSERDKEIVTFKSDISNRDAEIATLKTSSTAKDEEIVALKNQVAALKSNPADEAAGISPDGDGASDPEADFILFCDKNAGDTAAIAAEMERLNLN